MDSRDEPRRSHRISIPSIPAETVRWYLVVFNAITAYLTVTNTLFVLVAEQITGWQAIQYVVAGELLKAGGVALITSPIIVEAGKMVFAELWTEWRLRRAREQVHRLWDEWNQRRIEAEAKGEPFDEPPPKPEGRRKSSR